MLINPIAQPLVKLKYQYPSTGTGMTANPSPLNTLDQTTAHRLCGLYKSPQKYKACKTAGCSESTRQGLPIGACNDAVDGQLF